MANSPHNRNVRIGEDGTIYIGNEPQRTGSGNGNVRIGEDGTIYIGNGSQGTGSGTRTNTGSGSSTQSSASSTASSSTTDPNRTTWVIGCAIVGAIAFYFCAMTPDWYPVLIGAGIGAVCALLPRLSAGVWIIAFIIMLIEMMSKPSYTFFQTTAPMMAAFALFACMGLLRHSSATNAWEDWVKGLLYIVAALSLVVCVGIVQLDFSTPIIGPAYADAVTASNSNETCAREFAMQYYTNATVDSKGKEKPKEIRNWENRVRAYIKPGSPAEKKFDKWLKSAPSNGLGFVSIAERASTSTSGKNVITVIVTYKKSLSSQSSFAYATTDTQTFTCTMSEDHFIWDFE